MILRILSVLILALTSMTVVAAGDPIAGKAKSQTCVACHGAEGSGINPLWPKLAGQNPEYLKQQLTEFKKGKAGSRFEPTMYAMAANLSEKDIEDLAAYFASVPAKIGQTDPKLLALGESLYRGGDAATGVPACSACHSPNGHGNNLAKYPRLSGQYADYVSKRLNDFKNATGVTPDQVMQNIAPKLTPEQIQAVSSYVQGLQ